MIPTPITDNMDVFAEHFEGIDLYEAKISKSEFEDCTFVACDFSKCHFSFCKFTQCRFENCNFTLSRWNNSKLGDVEFLSCKMVGVDWTMADWKSLLLARPLRFEACLLDDSNFFGLALEGVKMRSCRLREVDFRGAKLAQAHFTGSDFKGALFENTHLKGANFTDAHNTAIDLRANHLKGAIFSRYEAFYLLESMGIVLVD